MNLKEVLRAIRKNYEFYIFCAPYLVFAIIFEILPIIGAFITSFQSYGEGIRGGGLLQPHYVGLKNYLEMFHDDFFWLALENTLKYTGLYLFLSTLLSLLVALILAGKIRGRTFFRTIYFMPYVTSAIIVSIVWRILLSEIGIVNRVLKMLGLPALFWLGPDLAIFSIVIVSVYLRFGYYVVLLVAGLQTIPVEFYEAATMDGANKFNQFRYVTYPLLRPILFFVLFLETVDGFQIFDTIFGMTRGGPGFASMNIPYYLYWQAFESFNLGYASAIGIFIMFIVFGILMIQKKLIGTSVEY